MSTLDRNGRIPDQAERGISPKSTFACVRTKAGVVVNNAYTAMDEMPWSAIYGTIL